MEKGDLQHYLCLSCMKDLFEPSKAVNLSKELGPALSCSACCTLKKKAPKVVAFSSSYCLLLDSDILILPYDEITFTTLKRA